MNLGGVMPHIALKGQRIHRSDRYADPSAADAKLRHVLTRERPCRAKDSDKQKKLPIIIINICSATHPTGLRPQQKHFIRSQRRLVTTPTIVLTFSCLEFENVRSCCALIDTLF